MRATLLAALVVAGCAPAPDVTPPYLKKVCAKSETKLKLTYMPAPIGLNSGISGWRWVPRSECVEHEMRCVWGEDYAGPKECAS